MTARSAFVFGSDGLPQQLQIGTDTLRGGQPNHVTNPASPYAAANYDDVWCSTASAAQTVTLPASPITGSLIGAMRSGANTLTVACNGNPIAGSVADLIINQDKSGVWCLWDAALGTWQLTSRTHA